MKLLTLSDAPTIRWPSQSFSHRTATTLLILVAESLLVYFVMSTFLGTFSYPLWVVLLLLGASQAAFNTGQNSWKHRYRRFASPGILVLAGIIAAWSTGGLIPASGTQFMLQAGVVAMLGLGWQRASYRQRIDLDSGYQLLQIGTIILTIISVVSIIFHRDISTELVAGILIFFALVLAAITALHRQQERSKGWDSTTPRSIAILFVVPVAVIGFLTYVISSVISYGVDQSMSPMVSILRVTLNVTRNIFQLIVEALVFIIIHPIGWIYGLLSGANRGEYVPDVDPQPGPEPTLEGEFASVPEMVQQVFFFAVVLILVVLLTRFLWKRVSFPASAIDNAEVTRDSVFRWRDLMPRRSTRKNGDRPTSVEDPLQDLREDAPYRFTLDIRERYTTFQQHGQLHGCARRVNESASEYSKAISSYLAAEPAIDRLTSLYRKTRYSGRPATEHDAEQVRQALNAVLESEAVEPPSEMLKDRQRKRIL